MFLSVVILVSAATCCIARVIDVSDKQRAWEQSGKFEEDIMLTDEKGNVVIKTASRWPDKVAPYDAGDVFNVSVNQSAWERSGKFEGDIMLSEEQLRNGLINTARRWRNKTVPFFIGSVFRPAEQNRIMSGINHFTARTTIRMVRRHSRPFSGDWVHVTGENSGCWSYVGRIGGRQQLNLQRNGCLTAGIIIHEFLHALGFVHEHSRTDRDNYVTIIWNNIQPGTESNFQRHDAHTITTFGVPYDYQSIMHYGTHAFTRNGQPTIRPTDPHARIGQRLGFSERDIEKLEKMYENSSYATRSQFITLIIITLHALTHLQ